MKVFFVLFCLVSVGFAQKNQPQQGLWKGLVMPNDRLSVPFSLHLEKGKYTISNGNENILLSVKKHGKDSLRATFPEADAELVFAFENPQSLRGYWRNLNTKSVVSVPFQAYFAPNEKRCNPVGNTTQTDFSGKWKTVFSPQTPQATNAIGLFNMNDQKITGTFLTESGDYRFLEGNVNGNAWQMSSFNGVWAFLVDATFENDTLKGIFYSGSSGRTPFFAVRDTKFELGNPNDLTTVVNDLPFQFQDFVTLKNKPFTFPGKRYKDKMVIFQIMGTWCPNCMDETQLFKEMYSRYNKQGLEIIALGYERGTDKSAQIKRLKEFKKRLKVPYQVLLCGTSSKDVAAKHFPMLSGISSFPTTVFLDRKGKIVAVHTGFNGPATGESYKLWVDGTIQLIEQYLLK